LLQLSLSPQAALQFIVYFPVDKQICVLKGEDIAFHDEKDLWNWKQWISNKEETITADGCYENEFFKCYLVQVAQSTDDLNETVRKLREIRREKHVSLDTLLDSVPRVRLHRRHHIKPLKVNDLV
jgi:hypothetical protein